MLAAALFGVQAAHPIVAQEGTSTFGHARARQIAAAGMLPSRSDIDVRDIFNRHRHELPRPRVDELIAFDVRFGSRHLTAGGTAVLQLGIATARTRSPIERPATDMVLVLDRSGSMAEDGKIVHLKKGLQHFVKALRPEDRVGIVAYDDEVLTVRGLEPVGDGQDFLRCVETLWPRGATDLHGGLIRGLSMLADRQCRRTGPGRVLLLTDGIANRGVVMPDAIATAANPFLSQGIELSVVGVGRNVQTNLLRTLAEQGRGLFHFVADGADLQKVFSDDAQALIDVVARDAQIIVEHDPALRVARVYGHRHTVHEGRLVISLDTVNLGMTEVAIVEFETKTPPDARKRLPVRATLKFVPSDAGRERTTQRLEQVASVSLASDGHMAAYDPEVRKNHTLAVLGQAMFDVAVACDDGRLVEARDAATKGLESVQLSHPKTEDTDLKTATTMLWGFSEAITNRLAAERPEVCGPQIDR